MVDALNLKIRLTLGREIAVGPGKADLLEAVQVRGSISAAARSLGMSYKRAWYLLDTMNRLFRAPVVETLKGGSGHGGAQLTPTGAQVLAHYRAIEVHAHTAAEAELAALTALLAETPKP